MIRLFPRPMPSADPGFATILLSAHQSAQGPVLRTYRDGRVVIDTGGGKLTGLPLGAHENARMRDWTPMFCGMI